MRPKNFSERRKRILTFAGLYAASIILMFFIFSAFGVHLSASEQKTAVMASDRRNVAGNDILQADSLLHSKLHQLQQSDDVYTLMLSDSSSTAQRTNAAAASGMYESAFKKAIDSVDQLANDYYGDKAAMFKTMVNSFKAIINNRQVLKNIQASMASGKTTLTGSQQDMLEWKTELTKKDNDLARMDEELKALRSRDMASNKSAGNEEAQKGETELLKTAFNDQLKDFNDVKERYNRLKLENSNLASQVVEYKKAAAVQNDNAASAAENKINALEQKVQDLNADVSFARVDCNLARADAQQIISNARQRKELLSESLSMLNSLAASGDAGIQKKAKDKIIRLNHIATALHD